MHTWPHVYVVAAAGDEHRPGLGVVDEIAGY
jgi:hypothetical protein